MNEAIIKFVNEEEHWQKRLAQERRPIRVFSQFVSPDEKQMAETFVVEGNLEDQLQTCHLKLNEEQVYSGPDYFY